MRSRSYGIGRGHGSALAIGVVIGVNDYEGAFTTNLYSEGSEKWLTLVIGSD